MATERGRIGSPALRPDLPKAEYATGTNKVSGLDLQAAFLGSEAFSFSFGSDVFSLP
jgi:hypothetical protein